MSITERRETARTAVLDAAAELVALVGVEGVFLDDVCRRSAVSRDTVEDLYGDELGLITAVAIRGFEMLADALRPLVETDRFADAAVAYVEFAVNNRGYFAAMFRRDRLDNADPALAHAKIMAANQLADGVQTLPDAALVIDKAQAAHAAWGMAHGIALLYLDGVFGDVEPASVVAPCARQLFAVPGAE